jgi:YidC/Oxa1 family membrane protein insertase
VLLVLYLGTQLASSLISQAPTMDRTQRRLILLLPLLFLIFIINFPAGLILYWITSNTWTMGQQWVIRRRIGPDVTAVPAAPASSPSGRDGRRAAANEHASGGDGGLSESLRRPPDPGETEPAAVGSSTRARREPPPPPPRSKKQRSGRRR